MRTSQPSSSQRLSRWSCALLIMCAIASGILSGCYQSKGSTEMGTKRQSIINGDVDLRHPAVVGIANDNDIFCTGTLISPRHVLTAAHCITEQDSTRLITDALHIRIDILNPDGNTYNMYRYRVTKLHMHPKYNPIEYSDDVAVLALERDVTETAPMAVLSTPIHKRDLGLKLLFVGFGYIQKVPRIVPTEHKRSALIPITSIYSFQLGTTSDTQSTCNGDSGGPGILLQNDKPHVAAITSNGPTDCKGEVYSMRADTYYNWIMAQVQGTKSQCQNSVECPVSHACRSLERDWQACEKGQLCVCIKYGKRALGQLCSDSSPCQDGLLCMKAGKQSLCMEPCTPGQGSCSAGGTCSTETSIPGLYICGCTNNNNTCKSGHQCRDITDTDLAMCLPVPASSQPPAGSQPPAQLGQQPASTPLQCPKAEQYEECGINGTCITRCRPAKEDPFQLGCQSQRKPPVSLLAVLLLLGLMGCRRKQRHG